MNILRTLSRSAIALGTFSLFGLTNAANAQVIVNGDFTTDISGWTTQGPFTQWSALPGPDAVSGVMFINDVRNAPAYAQQTITGLTFGQTYNISASYKSQVFFFTTASFTASVDGIPYFANPDISFVSAWTPFNFNFVAGGPTALLRFDSQVGSDSDYDLDKVVITTNGIAAVPEPGSVALLVGMAALGAGILRRRRK